MSLHNRKRIRTNNQSSNNSSISLASNSSGETDNKPAPTSTQNQPSQDDIFVERLRKIANDLKELHLNSTDNFLDLIKSPRSTELEYSYHLIRQTLQVVVKRFTTLQKNEDFYNLIRSKNRVDASTSTEPPPAPPTYNNVACMADTVPSPSAQPLVTSPSPKPGPRPPQTPTPKKAHLLTSRPRSHQVRSNVRLVACIAGRPDALTSETPRWKAVPTDCFSTLSKELKTIAPGCTPLSFHCNQKGNLIIAFTPSTPRSLLMSKLAFIRGAFELAHHVPILFDTPRSTIHLAHVQARFQDGSPIFDQSALAESILANPALSALPLISQPRWLRHPSKITGIRSSAVLTFEDPDGAIARQLLKTPIFVFGQPVTVKPWINKPSIITRHPRTGSAGDFAPMDI